MLADVGTGAVLGALRSAGLRPGLAAGTVAAATGAMAAGTAPMTALGITDPRTWSISDWISDLLPHFGLRGPHRRRPTRRPGSLSLTTDLGRAFAPSG